MHTSSGQRCGLRDVDAPFPCQFTASFLFHLPLASRYTAVQPGPLMPLPITDTRPFFHPLSSDIVHLLRTLSPDDWLAPTVAGTWRVRDIVAHLADTALRRLSIQR